MRHMAKLPRELALHHRNERVDNQGYVDDGLLCSDNTESSGRATELYGDMMDELSMEAHPEKSVQVVAGAAEWREKIKEDLLANPNRLQSFPVKLSKEEKYLGLYLVEGSYKPEPGRHHVGAGPVSDKMYTASPDAQEEHGV